jgi:hypothetical protein
MSHPSSEPNEHSGEIRKGHLRTVQTGNPFPEPETVDIAPDSMGGLDAEAMFRSAEALDEVDTTAPESPDTAAPMSNAPASAHDLTGYELPYADGSTTPAERPQHRPPRLRRPKQDPQLTAAIAATTTDIWAAHRNLPKPDQPEPQTPEPHHPQRGPRRRLSRGLIIGAFVAVILSVGATVALAGGGSSHPATAHHAQTAAGAAAADLTATSTASTATGLSIDSSLLEQHTAQRATQRRITAERAAKAKRAAQLKAEKLAAAKKARTAKKAAAAKKAAERKAVQKATSTSQASTPSPSGSTPQSSSTDVPAESAPAPAPSSTSSGQSSSSAGSTSSSSGPTGLGTSSGCSPKCS